MKELIFILSLFAFAAAGGQSTYFLDDLAGSDSNNGKAPSLALKSLDRINGIVLGPGDSVLFRRGGAWIGNFRPMGSGNADHKIVIGAYGNGLAPVLDTGLMNREHNWVNTTF